MIYDWTVGMEVSEWAGGSWAPPCPIRIMKIAAIGKLKLKTDDGQSWNVNHGQRWGQRAYSGPYIKPTGSTDRADMQRHKFRREAIRRIEDVRWRELKDEQLRAVLEAMGLEVA